MAFHDRAEDRPTGSTRCGVSFGDMRSFLAYLDERGQLAHVTDEVDPRFEIGAWIRRTSDVGGPAILFERVRGSDHRAVGGLFCSPDKALLALETDDHAEAVRRFATAIESPISPRVVAEGPCQEIVLTGDDIDLTRLPIPTYSEQDGGAFVTVGIGLTRDPESGTRNAGIYRMQLLGPRQLALAASPYSDFDAIRKRYEAEGREVEHAVAIGVDPVIHLATQARVGYGVDELGVAGALRGDAVELVRCVSVDLEVPATAEIVIEGRFRPGVRHAEGPFGEFSGYVGPGDPAGEPVLEVTAITLRRDAIYQAGLTGVPVTENHVLKSLPMEAQLLVDLRGSYPDVTAVHYPAEGGAEFLCVIALRQRYAYEARNVILSALGSTGHPKLVVVTDDDVDIYDMAKVWWAILTRCQPAEDVVIVDKAAGGQLDPSAPSPFVSSVMGIDATRPLGRPFPEVVRVPGVERVPDPRTLVGILDAVAR
jgi:4-hydroxy-3-polyprenylbenzoate decarboxylase/2,5-furandicarboxylate decarboxylase 1